MRREVIRKCELCQAQKEDETSDVDTIGDIVRVINDEGDVVKVTCDENKCIHIVNTKSKIDYNHKDTSTLIDTDVDLRDIEEAAKKDVEPTDRNLRKLRRKEGLEEGISEDDLIVGNDFIGA